MKKVLFLMLAVAFCASSLVACVDVAPNQSIEPQIDNGTATTQSNTQTRNQSQTSQSSSTNETSAPESGDDNKDSAITQDSFFNSLDYQWLQYAVFAVYKSEIADIDTEPAYCFETVQYDEITNTAVVQIPCQKDGALKYMTITMSRPKGSTESNWEKKNVEYKDQPNTENLVAADNKFLAEHYPDIQNLAFQFFRAYIQADVTTAVTLLDGGEKNLCLPNFNKENKGSLKDITALGFELIEYKYDETTGKGSVSLDVPYTPKDDDSLMYMIFSINISNETDANGNVTQKLLVNYFDFEA